MSTRRTHCGGNQCTTLMLNYRVITKQIVL